MNEQLSVTGERDAQLDNIRAILIFLVLIGHMTSGRLASAPYIRIIYYIINFFHMPVFVFITGYLSKNTEKGRRNAFRTFLVPYIIFDILQAVLDYLFDYKIPEASLIKDLTDPKLWIVIAGIVFLIFFIRSEKSRKYLPIALALGILIIAPFLPSALAKFKLTTPRWGMWFLLACFIWKSFAQDLLKIRFIFPISLILGMALPFFPDYSTAFTLGRIVGFLPFFVAGLLFTPEHLERIKRLPKIIGWSIISAVCVFCILMRNILPRDALYLRDPYSGNVKLMFLTRLLVYVIGFLMVIALFIVVSGKKSFLSDIGRNTLTVYIIHLIILRRITDLPVFPNNPLLFFIYSVCVAAALTWLLSRECVRRAYDRVLGGINRTIFKD